MLGIPRTTAAIVWTVVNIVTTVGIAAYSADWDHFTWWYQATFCTVALLAIVGLDAYLFFFFQGLSLQVISAVILMSIVDCTVFEEAYKKLYSPQYLSGDFAMHYAPSLIALALVDTKTLCVDPVQVRAQIWCSLAVFLNWAFFHNPWEVYGCNLPEYIVVAVPWALTAVFDITVSYLLAAPTDPKSLRRRRRRHRLREAARTKKVP